MPRHFSSGPADSLVPEVLDLTLFHLAQTYLQSQYWHGIPSAGQTEAWDRFYDTYDPLLRRFVVACGVLRVDAEDCRQDVWMDVIKKLPAFASDGTQGGLCSWLHTIVHAKAVDLVRYHSRHPSKPLRPEAEAALVSPDAAPAVEYEQRGRQEEVQRILAVLRQRLSVLTYHAFYEHWVEGHTTKQIAAELNVTQRRVACRLYTAKQKFRLLCDQLVRKGLLTDG